MKISETTYTVNKYGCLRFPAAIMQEMGLGPGSHVRVAYLTKDGEENSFREFYLSPHGIENTATEEEMIAVPDTLLRQANLSENADIQILCLDGCILICRDDRLNLEELISVLDGLQTANDVVSQLPDELDQVQSQLAEITEDLRERSEYEL